MIKRILGIHILLSYGLGFLLTYSFAPYSFWILSILLPSTLFYIWSSSSVKLAALSGLSFGMGYFSHGVSWILNSIHECGTTPFVFSLGMSLLFWSCLSLFPVLTSCITAKAHEKYSRTKIAHVVIFAASWSMFEIIRGWIFTGFPWLLLGNSHIESPLKHFAPVVGVYGISFVSLMLSGLLYIVVASSTKNKVKRAAATLLIFISILNVIFFEYQWTKKSSDPIKISLIQSNIMPTDKYASKTPLEDAWNAYAKKTIKNSDSDIIVWPEHSVPVAFPKSEKFLKKIDSLAKENDTTVIAGFPYKIPNDPTHYYNALAAFGNNEGMYFKKHLVPYGEYIPFVEKIEQLSGKINLPEPQFRPGPDNPLLKINNHEILPLICYEIAHPEFVRHKVNTSNPEFLLNINEDGYFDKYKGPYQNLEIARMRALENGRYAIRSSATGISALIDDQGRILNSSPLHQVYTVKGEIIPHTGRTPFAIFGVWNLFIILNTLILASFVYINRYSIIKKLERILITFN